MYSPSLVQGALTEQRRERAEGMPETCDGTAWSENTEVRCADAGRCGRKIGPSTHNTDNAVAWLEKEEARMPR